MAVDQMKASDLKFDCPGNSKISLNVVAEQVGKMEWNVASVDFKLREKRDQIVIVIDVPPPTR